MRTVRPGTSYTFLFIDGPEGIADDLTAGIVNVETGEAAVAQSDDGIVEINAPSGNYSATRVLPDDEGLYVPQWVYNNEEYLDDEVIRVDVSAPVDDVELSSSYASQADLEAYLEDGLPAGFDSDYLDKVLGLASDDVDRYCSNFIFHEDSLQFQRKFFTEIDPANVWRDDISTQFQRAITRATCAQAEYRLAKGDQFFVEKQRAEGEFSGTQVTQPRFGPKAEEELRAVGFMVRIQTATLR